MSHRSRYIHGLGVLFIAIAAVQSVVKVVNGGVPLEATIDFVLISLPGILFLYVGGWLSSTDLDPELYPRIAIWSLGGVSVMFVFLFLRAVHPGVAASFTFGERAIALALGSVAGLGIGIHEAQAITREREVNQRNEALKRTRRRLERRNRELSQTRDDLEAAVERLQESNERLDHFASIVSHDLREPLRMVTSYLGLIEDRYADDLDDDGEEFIEYAVDGAERMQTMIDDLLRYSRIETKGNPFEPVELDAVLDDVRQDIRVSADETDATITVESLPCVRGDESQLRQLFQNLLSNAIEYSGDDPPRIHVAADRTEATWVLSVRDHGIGIDPDDQDRIFELFQRLHAIDDSEGSGIGLAFCRRIVERHGGEIWVDSEPGNGSTFSFTLPDAVDAPVPADANPQH